MVFRNALARLGVGNVGVDAVLDSSETTPGGRVSGAVDLTGGKVAQDIDEIRVELVTTVRVPYGDTARQESVSFDTRSVAGTLRIEPGEKRRIPFSVGVPMHSPFTSLDAWRQDGLRIGLRARAGIPGAVSPVHLEPVDVLPLPVHRAVVRALAERGFTFIGAELSPGPRRGSNLPFCQELGFTAPRDLGGRMKRLQVTFLTAPQGVNTMLAVNRPGRPLSEGPKVTRLFVGYQDTDVAAIGAGLDDAIGRLRTRRER